MRWTRSELRRIQDVNGLQVLRSVSVEPREMWTQDGERVGRARREWTRRGDRSGRPRDLSEDPTRYPS